MSYVQNNARLAAVANALQGKFALVREFDSLKLIYSTYTSIPSLPFAHLFPFVPPVLSADCLLNPGSKRLTAFDIHVAAVVYTRSTPSHFVISTAWKSLVAFDLVALFGLDGSPVAAHSVAVPPTPSFARPQAAPAPQVINPPSTWTQSLDMLERSAGSYGGIEGLPCVFADEDAMATLLGSASTSPTPPTPAYPRSSCASRRESYAAIAPLVPSFSISH